MAIDVEIKNKSKIKVEANNVSKMSLDNKINNEINERKDGDNNLQQEINNLSKVASTGDYNDLINKPEIPSGQIQSDWAQENSNEVDYIKNKPQLGTASQLDAGKNAYNVPQLNKEGKLDSNIIPAVAITDTYTCSSEAQMLALTCQKGDVCVRSDLNKSFILSQTPASTLTNWKELLTPTDAVLSVNNKTGVVTLDANDVGVSGTNDGSAWTSITINGVTYPVGGADFDIMSKIIITHTDEEDPTDTTITFPKNILPLRLYLESLGDEIYFDYGSGDILSGSGVANLGTINVNNEQVALYFPDDAITWENGADFNYIIFNEVEDIINTYTMFHPLPDSAIADRGKYLHLNSSTGALEWAEAETTPDWTEIYDNNSQTGIFYFAELKPNWPGNYNNLYRAWRVKYEIEFNKVDSQSNNVSFSATVIIGSDGSGNGQDKCTITAHNRISANPVSINPSTLAPVLNHYFYTLTKSGLDNNYGHLIGFNTLALLFRKWKFRVRILETSNCQVSLWSGLVPSTNTPQVSYLATEYTCSASAGLKTYPSSNSISIDASQSGTYLLGTNAYSTTSVNSLYKSNISIGNKSGTVAVISDIINVVANPGNTTSTLSSIQIGNTNYEIQGGGGGGSISIEDLTNIITTIPTIEAIYNGHNVNLSFDNGYLLYHLELYCANNDMTCSFTIQFNDDGTSTFTEENNCSINEFTMYDENETGHSSSYLTFYIDGSYTETTSSISITNSRCEYKSGTYFYEF